MLISIGIKDGIVLYHIGYGIVLGYLVTNGVIGCGQPTCWLIDVGLITKLGYIKAYYIGSPTWVVSVLNTIGCRKVWSSSLINFFNLSSTKEQYLNSCPTCWQYAQVNVVVIISANWKRCNYYGHIITGCCRLPFMSYRGYLINMLNMFDIMFTWLCIWPSLLGWLSGCQKSTNWRYLSFFSFFQLYEYLMKKVVLPL